MNCIKMGSFLCCLLLPLLSSSQESIWQTNFDLDQDGQIEQLLFFKDPGKTLSENGFYQFCIQTTKDTICITNEEGWVEQPSLYQEATHSINNQLGIIRDSKRVFLWLTGFQYGCCLNVTSVYEWKNQQLIPLFEEEFEVQAIRTIEAKKYMLGISFLTEIVGDGSDELPIMYCYFVPMEYRQFAANMAIDSQLTRIENLKYSSFDQDVNVFNAQVMFLPSGYSLLYDLDKEYRLFGRTYFYTSVHQIEKTFFEQFDLDTLRIIRNELFAYYGYQFRSPDLKTYFEKETWYQPNESSSKEIESQLTDIEQHNLSLIRLVEAEKTKK